MGAEVSGWSSASAKENQWETAACVSLRFSMPGDRDALLFLGEINSFFSFVLIIIHFKIDVHVFLLQKSKIVSSNTGPQTAFRSPGIKNVNKQIKATVSHPIQFSFFNYHPVSTPSGFDLTTQAETIPPCRPLRLSFPGVTVSIFEFSKEIYDKFVALPQNPASL
jgi:hypothetical protein